MRVCAVEDQASLWLEDEKRSLADYYITDYDDLKREIITDSTEE